MKTYIPVSIKKPRNVAKPVIWRVKLTIFFWKIYSLKSAFRRSAEFRFQNNIPVHSFNLEKLLKNVNTLKETFVLTVKGASYLVLLTSCYCVPILTTSFTIYHCFVCFLLINFMFYYFLSKLHKIRTEISSSSSSNFYLKWNNYIFFRLHPNHLIKEDRMIFFFSYLLNTHQYLWQLKSQLKMNEMENLYFKTSLNPFYFLFHYKYADIDVTIKTYFPAMHKTMAIRISLRRTVSHRPTQSMASKVSAPFHYSRHK